MNVLLLLRRANLNSGRQSSIALLVGLDKEVLGEIEFKSDQRGAIDLFARLTNQAFPRPRKQVKVIQLSTPLLFHPHGDNIQIAVKIVELLARPHSAISHWQSVASELFGLRRAFIVNAYNINSAALPD